MNERFTIILPGSCRFKIGRTPHKPRPFMGGWVTRRLDVPKCLSCNGILVIATSQRPGTGRHLVREEYSVGCWPVGLG